MVCQAADQAGIEWRFLLEEGRSASARESEMEDMTRLKIDISGMRCNHCISRVLTALRTVTGVREVTVTIGQAIVLIEDTVTRNAVLFAAIRGAGPFDVIGFGVERNPDA